MCIRDRSGSASDQEWTVPELEVFQVQTLKVTTTCWWWLSTSSENNQQANTQKTQVLPRKAERSQDTFQAIIDGKFAPLTIMNNEDSDVNSTITTSNTAVTETANEIFGKHCKKKKPWITAEILDLCYKWREWKLKIEKKKIGTWRVWEIKGSERHQETISVNHKKKKKNNAGRHDRHTAKGQTDSTVRH